MTNKNLILTRKLGERVVLHTGSGQVLCTITLTNISNKQCKIAFEANPNVRIDREEIYTGDINETNISKGKKTSSKGNNT